MPASTRRTLRGTEASATVGPVINTAGGPTPAARASSAISPSRPAITRSPATPACSDQDRRLAGITAQRRERRGDRVEPTDRHIEDERALGAREHIPVERGWNGALAERRVRDPDRRPGLRLRVGDRYAARHPLKGAQRCQAASALT